MTPMYVVSITGGKGGTGKSFVATNLAYYLASRLGGLRIVLADLDVEAPNDHILLGVNRLENMEDIDIFFPKIIYEKCTACGACVKVCDTGAMIMAPGKPPFVFPRLCSGCKACYYACPYDAIRREGRRTLAHSYETHISIGSASFTLVTGVLKEGEEHTPPAIIAAKKRALGLKPDVLLVDTGAGTGSGVSTAIHGSDLVIAVTEPTPLGVHDLKSILEVVEGMGYEALVVVNRHGIGPSEAILEVVQNYSNVRGLYRIPYSRRAAEAYARGVPVIHYYPDDPASQALARLGGDVLARLRDAGVVDGGG